MGDSRAGALASLTRVAAQWAYGSAFVVALPACLAAWGQFADRFIALPAPDAPVAGRALAAAGLALVVWAFVALFRDGGGLPMNAFPPPRFVASGPAPDFLPPVTVCPW